MDRKTKICLWVMLAGLANFLAYVVLYIYFYGEAVNGGVFIDSDGQTRYFLQSGVEVSRAVFIYSGVHSISIWPTVAAIVLAVLTLAKDRIIASMHATVVRGREFMTIFAVVVVLITGMLTYEFTHTFAVKMRIANQLSKSAAEPAATTSIPTTASAPATMSAPANTVPSEPASR